MVIFFSIIVLFVLFIFLGRIRLGFTLRLENSVCSVFLTIYFFSIALKKIMIFPPRINKKKRRAKKVRKKRDLKQLRVSLKVLIRLFKRAIILREFVLKVKLGTGDAFYTAMLYGLIWSLAGFIPTYIFNDYKIKNKEINIEPNFNERIININFNCIFSLKIVNIIVISRVVIKEYLNIKKGGDADVRSSNRRTNDYSHAKY